MYRMKLNPVLLGPKVFIVEHVSLQYLVCYSFRQECMNPKHPRSRSLEFADDTHSATLYLDIPTRHYGHSPTCCPTPLPPPLPGEGYKTQFYTRLPSYSTVAGNKNIIAKTQPCIVVAEVILSHFLYQNTYSSFSVSFI